MKLLAILLVGSCVAAISYAQTGTSTGQGSGGSGGMMNNGGFLQGMMMYNMFDNFLPMYLAMNSGMMGGGARSAGGGFNSLMPLFAWNTMN